MYNITLLGTRHKTIGKCNSDELYQIIERINPQVIFEEIHPSSFDQFYVDKSRSNLETDTINRYTQHHEIDHIPVDSYTLASDSLLRKHRYMFERIEGLADINGSTLRQLVDTSTSYSSRYGFNYLNSPECINIYSEINDTIYKGLQIINDDKLFQTFNKWKDVTEMRERHMLKNIYNYSSLNSYDRAIFTIGSSHRGSIIEKIAEFQKSEKVKLNWII